MPDPVFWLIICRTCHAESGDTDPLVQPFASAETRGRWAGEHTRALGHDSWLVWEEWQDGHTNLPTDPAVDR